MESLLKNSLLNIDSVPVAAGTSDVNGAAIDMQGYGGAMFIASLGTITSSAVTSMIIEESNDGSTGWTTVTGSTLTIADTGDDRLYVIDVNADGRKRYLRQTIDRGTANAVVNLCASIRYGSRKGPVSQSSSYVGGSASVA